MSLKTFSVFYYGPLVNEENIYLDFKEGVGPNLTIQLNPGRYAMQELLDHVADMLNETGTLNYVVTVNRETKKVTITASGTFSLLQASGTNVDNDIFETLGFTGNFDRTGASAYTGNSAMLVDEYRPQFILQSHISTENKQRAIDATVRKTTSGKVEVVKFGTEKFLTCNIQYATNLETDGRVIKNNPTGVEDLQNFMRWCVEKGNIEYMPDIGDRNTYETLILESTTEDKNGLGYELKELYDRGLPEFFETGKLMFRKVE